MSEHPSYHSRLSRATTAAAEQPVTSEPAASPTTWRYSDRACCCAAQPAVVAVLPPRGPRRGATDLLLCGHHYRASKVALATADATILDLEGCELAGEDWPADRR